MEALQCSSSKKRKRGVYNSYGCEQSAKMIRRAVEHGLMNASRKFNVNESTITNMKQQYLRQQTEEGAPQNVLVKQDRGKPLLVSNQIDSDNQTYAHFQRQAGNPVVVKLLFEQPKR